MVPDFVLARATALAKEVSGTQNITSRAAFRDALEDSLGIMRLPRSPRSHTRTVERVATRDGYVIEKIVFESTPGFPIPAFLYLPDGPGPHPAVVHPPGHWMEDARLAEPLQLLNQRLARSGIACLSYDTLGQGERRIGWHQHGQLAPLLVGITSLGMMVRDTFAALDILARRPELDPARLGVVGASGGAYSSIFAAALDDRISVAVIACIVNTHVGQIRDAAFGTGWDGWVDLCNQVPKLCSIGTLGEILGLVAPRTLLIANAVDDPPFPLSGSREVAEQVRARYLALGVPESFTYAEVPGTHGFQPNMRTVATEFLVKSLGQGPAFADGTDAPAFSPRWPVPHNLATASHPQTRMPIESVGTCLAQAVDTNQPLVDLARARATELRTVREPLTKARLCATLGPFPERVPLCPVVSNHIAFADRSVQRLSLHPEPGITIDALVILPRNWTDYLAPVLVVLDEGGKSQALHTELAEQALAAGFALVLPDLRGTGESATSEFEVATAAWMLDRDLLNQRVWDTIRLIDFLSERYSSSQQIDKARIAVLGFDAFGVVALIAGALDARIAVTGSSGPASLEDALTVNSWITPMLYHHNLLATLDIDDLVQLTQPRPAIVGEPDTLLSAIVQVIEGNEQ